ncbi:hypothetical protein [uncultured Sphingomonas sp.]|uniref:hypothetical protein n=1 Tax=uncultured Sphingomonas sp. TaxID=158754 RepID=UPI0025FA951F|nr:hypothetical protein [uncultured Sphingomonas sp.]
MIDTLRPWIGLAVGAMLTINGYRKVRDPNAFVGVGPIPATDPRTVRFFGIGFLVLGLLNVGLILSQLLSE